MGQGISKYDSNWVQVGYHVCNYECKNNKKHKETLKSFNDSIDNKVRQSFKAHGVHINKSTDKELIFTPVDDINVPKKIYYDDEQKKIHYHAENIITTDEEPKAEDKNYKNIKKTLCISAGVILFTAATLFMIPKSRDIILKSLPKLKTVLIKTTNKFVNTMKTAKNYLSNKFKTIINFFKSSKNTKQAGKFVKTSPPAKATVSEVKEAAKLAPAKAPVPEVKEAVKLASAKAPVSEVKEVVQTSTIKAAEEGSKIAKNTLSNNDISELLV